VRASLFSLFNFIFYFYFYNCPHPALILIFFTELPDLTDPETLARFRKWDVASIGYAHLLRFVRISSALPDVLVLSRAPAAGAEADEGEEDDEAPELLDDEMDET
jgi:translation machinery-associated protein 16